VSPRDSTPGERHDGEASRLQFRDEVDELFARANPNPSRIGCPTADVLVTIARRERPIDDPLYSHVIGCSPCYLEVRTIQEAEKKQRFRSRLAWVAAAAAVLLIAVIGGRLILGVNPERGGEVLVERDLRPYAIMRGEPQAGSLPPLMLPRARVRLALTLPTGSEPGPYEVQIRHGVVQTSAAIAEMRGKATVLQTSLDLSQIPMGSHDLAVRRDGGDWQVFSTEIR
jgi:hypothetical protein